MCKQLKKHKKAILFVTIKIKIVDIKMPRKYSFAYRRSNPGQFPYVCDTCVPQRRFLLPLDRPTVPVQLYEVFFPTFTPSVLILHFRGHHTG